MGDKRVLVCGAGGFVAGHLVRRLKSEGHWVRGVDLEHHRFSTSPADESVIGDLRDPDVCSTATRDVDDVYQLAADMGGAGYIFTGEHDAAIMHNSALVNLNVLDAAHGHGVKRILYTSSACIYPEHNQADPANPNCAEQSAYPAAPDSEYGWEKLFSERLYLSYARNCDIDVHIARLHNVFGPEGTWRGGREKVPAAICRKVAEASQPGEIEVWGDGLQTRSFLYIDECLEGLRRLMESDFSGPVNLGSEEMVSINELVEMVAAIAGKTIKARHIDGPLGVRGRNSDNKLIAERLGWAPTRPLRDGMEHTYRWIAAEVAKLAQEA